MLFQMQVKALDSQYHVENEEMAAQNPSPLQEELRYALNKAGRSHFQRYLCLPPRREENAKDHRHKLSPFVEGRFKITKA